MDKNMNRTDLLAAGRKKLQQYRKKKDKKGSSSNHGKSLSKTSKPDNNDDTEEPSNMPEPHPVIDADEPSSDPSDPAVIAKLMDSLLVPAAEAKEDQEELPSVSLDNQEANNIFSQECNGDRLEKNDDDIDGVLLATDSERDTEDLAAFSSSGLEAIQEMYGSSLPCEVSGKYTTSSSIFNEVGDEKDWKQISSKDHDRQRGEVNVETASLAQKATPSSFLAAELQEAAAKLSDKPEERASLEENLEVLSASHAILSTDGEDAVAVVEAEVERIDNQEQKVAHSVKTEGTASLEESFAGLPSSQNVLADEGEYCTGEADEEGERRHDEKIMLQYGKTEEEIGPSIPDEVVKENTDVSHIPEESTSVQETLKTISSSSQGISDIEGGDGARGDGAVVADEEGVRRNDTDYKKQTGRAQEANSCSISREVLYEANTTLSEELREASYIEENLETVTSSTEDIPASKEEDVAGNADGTEDERIVMEGSVLQSSLGKIATPEFVGNLPEQRVISSVEVIDKGHSHVCSSNSEVESIKQLLYITINEKDVLQLQLNEQIALSEENQQQSFDEVAKLRDLLKETQDSYAVVNTELEQCRSGLQAMSIAKEELEIRCLSTEEKMEEIRTRASELQSKLNQSQEGLQLVLIELADCRVSLQTLQKENMELAQSLIFEKDATKKLMEEKEFLSSENNRLASDVVEQKQQLIFALDTQADLQSNLRDTVACFDQLAEENVYLASSLDVHKVKIKEHNERHLELPSESKNSGNQGVCLHQKQAEDHGNSVLFGGLKRLLDEANNMLHNLEKSVDGMHSHTASVIRSGGRVAAPGISKIIQAFESKAHNVENISDDQLPLIEGGHAEDSYAFTKEQTCSLRDVLKQMELELGKAEINLMNKQNSKEYLNKFGVEPETQNEQTSFFRVRIDKLVEKVSDYKSKIVVLENHIDEIQQNANEGAVELLSQVEMLQKEVNDKLSIFKQENESMRGVIIDATEKLSSSTKLQVDDGLDIGSHFIASVDAAVRAIQSLHDKLEAAYFNYNTLQASFEEFNTSFLDLQAMNGLAFELLKKLYSGLTEFVDNSYQGEAMMDANTDEFLQFLGRNCDLLIGHLQKLMDERHRLLSTNNELEVGLLNRIHVIEELNMRYDALSKKLEDEYRTNEGLESILLNRSKSFEEVSNRILSLVQKLEHDELMKDLEGVSMPMKSDNMESDLCMSTLLRLEALIAFHLQNREEVIEQINSSKIYLQEVNIVNEISGGNWSLPLHTLLRQEFIPKVSELKGKLELLGVSNLQQETEIQILREALSKMEEALEASRSELNLKLSELEQSEQRLSSVREKLSIAVAKGKGLIVQRDSLKQSLIDKLNELEKCMQELQSKETLLHEVEAKLKSCSEVDRVEALESELSYIRDSATALRDSFLLKDSVLQRIEEVLEDLDLPEHFHSKDIVEKIELLSRLVTGNSSIAVTDWDQKSFEGRSHSDAGFVVMDNWKDDMQTSSNEEFDELKRKYEDLRSKFYGLAEHNDMLEQSLLERNSLVRKWEEMLDRIDMPSHLRTLEPEDRIESLGKELFELQQEIDALQLKIENLEVSSDMLIVDLEESHKKISELSAEVVTVKSEKDFFSESLDKLRFQYLVLSEKAVHDEVERENLQREVADLQEKLVEKVDGEAHRDIENELQKLHNLIVNVLPDSDKSDAVSGLSGFASLEALIRKLIDNYTVFSADKSKHILAPKEAISEESNISLDKQSLLDAHDKDRELSGLRMELDEASQSLVLVKEERDAALEKCHSLTLEIDEITRQMHFLQEERNHDMEKHQSLVLELEGLILAKEERDAALEKCHSLILEMDEITRQVNLLQEERIHNMEKHQSLVLELEAVGKHRDTLQEQVIQEEQKSSAVREKLNVAVRKGKGLVQQRDALKQTIEEMNTTVEHLKAEHNQRVETLQLENISLMNQLAESKQNFEECTKNLSRLLAAVLSIDIGSELNIVDPVQKIEEIGKIGHDLHSALVSSQQEAKKAKQAAELLLTELNEVQDRVDSLQEELRKAEAALEESYQQKHDAEAAKVDALSRLEQFMLVHSEERKKQVDTLVELMSDIDQLRKGCIGFSSLLSDVCRKDVDLFSYVQSFLESILKQMNGENAVDPPILGSSDLYINPISEQKSCAADDMWQLKVDSHLGDNLICEHLNRACCYLNECVGDFDDLKEQVHKYLFSIHRQQTSLSETLETVKRKLGHQKEYSESFKEEVTNVKLVIKEKETEICSMRRNLSLLYEACWCSIVEIENRKAQVVQDRRVPEGHVSGKSNRAVALPSYVDSEEHGDEYIVPYTDQSIRTMADSLLSSVQSSTTINETAEANQRELRATIIDLQRELQEKDIEMKRISEELVSQIRDAEAVAKRSLSDLDSAKAQIFSLEKKVVEMENDKQLLESRISELQDCKALLQSLQEKFKSLTDSLAAKDQEIEGLMQALDEEETQMEALENRNKELEDIVQEKLLALENLESSKAKAMAKLSTTVSKFDELHNLSENLLAEIESLESQLQERDSEISFLRQEVTRCTNNDLASQETNKKYLSEINEVLTWMEMMVSRLGQPHTSDSEQNCSQIHVYTDILDKRIASFMNELEDLRMRAQSKDALLQIERGRVEELLRKSEGLATIHEKEIQREPFQGESDSIQPSSSSSPRHVEIEQMVQRNKVYSAPIVTHIRSGRKVNNDQVAIAIDMENDNNVLDDEDDDKAHGFKSLTMSRLVPRATRPISDRIDAIWVSAERLLMRQPSLRLGVILYWVLLHALLASII